MKSFSPLWKSSRKPRKQRKYRFAAPLHRKQKALHTHLSGELRRKYRRRSFPLRTGDTVKVLRGQFANKEGKVERVLLKYGKVYVTGLELVKKEGTKRLCPLEPSNLLLTEIETGDKYRKENLEKAHEKPS